MRKRAWLWLLSLTLFVPALLTACGGSSAAPPAPTPTAQAESPRATEPTPPSATPALQATTAAPQPSPTSSAAEATPTEAVPTVAPAEFQIEGSPDFIAWTEEALELLRTRAPEWYEQVAESIETLRSVPAGSGMDVFNKVYMVGDVTAYAPDFPPAGQLIWYAGTIVHDSCHSERFDEGLVYLGKEGEVACLMDQKAALLLLDTDPYFSDYVQSLIDGADDPSNAYWNNPDRHW